MEKCIDEFEAYYGYPVFASQYRVEVLEGDPETYTAHCLVIKQQINTEEWAAWSESLSSITPAVLRDRGYKGNKLFSEFKYGECGVFPYWFYGELKEGEVEDPFFRDVGMTSCFSAHDFEVIHEFTYIPPVDTSYEEDIDNIVNICDSAGLLFEGLDYFDEIRDFWGGTNVYPLTWNSDTLLLEKKETKTLCLMSYYGSWASYKVDFSILEMLEVEIYQNNNIIKNQDKNKEPKFELLNCPSEPVKGYPQDSTLPDQVYNFKFEWKNLPVVPNKLNLSFKDSFFVMNFEMNQIFNEKVFENAINFYFESAIIMEYLEGAENIGIVEFQLLYGEDNILSDICKFDIISAEE